jgi:hypothetical protein
MNIDTDMKTLAAADRPADSGWTLQWTAVVAGAFVACAVSSILITFGATIGLGVSSAAPTWRDASVALAVLSGIYLVLQALISFGCGGYFAGRCRIPYDAGITEQGEQRDGLHGVASWALAVILGVALAALVAAGVTRHTSLAPPSTTEPSIISSEIDHLFRATRRPPNIDLAPPRAEAGRVLMTSSSHSGVSADDRAYLVQLVTATTGLTGAEAERRVDSVISQSKRAISHTRASSIILAFSAATALLFGAVAAWAGAEAGGRHRNGMPLSDWMLHSNRLVGQNRWRRRLPNPMR